VLYTLVEQDTFSIQKKGLAEIGIFLPKVILGLLEDNKNNRFSSQWLLVFQNKNLNINIVLCYSHTLCSAARE